MAAALIFDSRGHSGFVAGDRRRAGSFCQLIKNWRSAKGAAWRCCTDTLRIFLDHRVLGTGLGTLQEVFPLYETFYDGLIVNHSHNDYAEALAETGAIGGLCGLAFLVLLFWTAWKILVWKEIREISPIMPEPWLPAWGFWCTRLWTSTFIFHRMRLFFCCRRPWLRRPFRRCHCRAGIRICFRVTNQPHGRAAGLSREQFQKS